MHTLAHKHTHLEKKKQEVQQHHLSYKCAASLTNLALPLGTKEKVYSRSLSHA